MLWLCRRRQSVAGVLDGILVSRWNGRQRWRTIIRENLLWALGYNLLAVPFAAAGYIVPWMAALGMSLSSLLVVLNSGRLARNKTVRTQATMARATVV